MKLLYSLIAFITALSLQAQNHNPAVVTNRLLDELKSQPEGLHHVSILMADRLNVEQFDAQMINRKAPLSERRKAVILSLQEKADNTQLELIDFLTTHPKVEKQSIRSFWIANMVFVKAPAEVIAQLSWRKDVAKIDKNARLRMVEYTEENCEYAPPAPGRIEPGIAAIKAPELWKMGYTGAGRKALGSDTGIEPSHPAIRNSYQGIYSPQEQSWFNYVSPLSLPFDCDNHGTHTIGTVLGLDRLTFDTIGVAYDAVWMGANILCSGLGTEDNIASFQWALDPDGDPNTMDDMPDAINNSWYDPDVRNDECDGEYVDVLNALEAAGVAVIFSAGNEGPDDATITPPHNINTNIVNSFTVGAVNGNSPSYPIAGFSSRGPSQCGGDSSILIKPEVSAPGVSVRSSIRNGEYSNFSGTSMAAPHVVGAILLLKQAFPYLSGKDLKLALYFTARDLGTPGEDNVFGMGIIDVKAAFDYLVAEGHTPVDPTVTHDALLLDLKVREFYCDELVYPEVYIENNGSTTLTELEIAYEVINTNVSGSARWTGNLQPGERTFYTIPEFHVPRGTYELGITLKNPNNSTDGRPFNNKLITELIVTDRPTLNAFAVAGDNNAVCENSPVLLRSQVNGPGNIVVQWYDAPAGGNLIGEGAAFQTPPIAANTTFYADARFRYSAGKKDRGTGAFRYPSQALGGLRFNAESDFLLKSVKVYAAATGSRTIGIKNADNDILDSLTVMVNDTGFVEIDLNFQVERGANLRMEILKGKAFGYLQVHTGYPYTIQDIVNIFESTLPTNPQGTYFYFFDWTIEQEEICGRTPVTVNVISGADLPQAAFDLSDRTLDLINSSGIVNFTDNSTGASEWNWHFGDGNSSTEQNPAHQYTQVNSYIVSLTVKNGAGCTSSAIDTVIVVDSSVSTDDVNDLGGQVNVFPNPTSGTLQVTADFEKSETLNVTLTDLTGRQLQKFVKNTSANSNFFIDLNGFQNGIYLLIFETKSGRSVRKVVKF